MFKQSKRLMLFISSLLLILLFAVLRSGPRFAALFRLQQPTEVTEVALAHELAPLPNIAQIVAGSWHTCVLTVGGGMQCWGANGYGQLGDGSLEVRTLPGNVSGLASGVQTISAGSTQTCAVMDTGSVRCWGGYDTYYQETITQTLPVEIKGLAGIVEVAVGSDHVCALTSGGGVKCWTGGPDFNSFGYVVTSTTPVDITGLTSDVVSIASGSEHVCALTNTGGVKCWGDNYYGQLGDGTTDSRAAVRDVAGLTSGVSALRANANHTCALLNSGALKCWGANYEGQLGDGSTSNRPQPVDVVGLSSNVITLAVGGSHSCAVLSNGAAQCWGNNQAGQLGDSTTTRRNTPVDVITLNRNVTQLSAGDAHTCALLNTGVVKCWGNNSSGQLGNGASSRRTSPIDVVGLNSGINTIAAGGDTSCAVTSGGGVKCWGGNNDGQIGDGTTVNRPAPVDVVDLNEVNKVASSGSHSCALTATGSLFCWGNNSYGQLGNGATTNSMQPGAVTGLSSGVVDLAVGGYHTCALLNNGGIKCWGYNSNGQLGDNTTINRATAVDVVGLTAGVKAITAGAYHSCALLDSGAVQCWGYNGNGQLGDGSTIYRLTPFDVVGLTAGVKAITAGAYHSCALLDSGAVQCWGYNGNGQLGDGSTTDRTTAVAVSGLSSGVSNIAGNIYHTCAVTAAGVAKCWGDNYEGQLGDGTTINRFTPVDVIGLNGAIAAAATGATNEQAIAIAPGIGHTCALTRNQGVKCWGANYYGQLGDGGSWRTIAVDVVTACRVLTVTHSGTGNPLAVTPASSPGCSDGNYVAGEVIGLTAAPAANWQVAGWSGTSNDATTTLTNTVIMPAGNHTVSVAYSQGCYTLSFTQTGSGSALTATPANSPTCPAGQYVANEPISLSAAPAAGWAISGWQGTANDAATTPTNMVQMPAHNHTVNISYTQPCYTLTLLHSGAGSDPSAAPTNSAACPAGQYVSGETITLSAAPSPGWVVSGWQGVANSTTLNTTLLMPSNDQTVNVSYSKLPTTTAPPGTDAFEEDDTCSTAKAIATNNLAQERTFHKPGDTDWVRFAATGGATYRIEALVPITAPTDINLEVYNQCDSAASTKFVATFAPGVRLDVPAQANAAIYLRLSNSDVTVAGAQVAYRLSVRQLQIAADPSTSSRGLLILVAGRLKNPDAVQKNINFVTQSVYDLYKANGYTDDSIQYLATDPSMTGYDKPATLANLQEAIVNWAKGKLTANQQLTLYLMDHGDKEKFFVDGVTQQVLTPTLLSGWLDQVEAAVPSAKVTVIIEACYSGSFIEGVQRVSKPGRLIIASTTAATVAYASAAGAYFSDQLVVSLRQDYSLHNSFRAAYVVARELTGLLQEPWLDGNGNGIPNEAEDVALASQRGLGYADKSNNESWSPYVVNVQGPNAIVNRRGAIVAEVRDNKRVRRVWAVIYSPSYQPPTNSQELVPETLPTIVLPLQNKDTFGSEYPGFDEFGLYRIAVYAEDDDGLLALPKVIRIQNGLQQFLPLVAR